MSNLLLLIILLSGMALSPLGAAAQAQGWKASVNTAVLSGRPYADLATSGPAETLVTTCSVLSTTTSQALSSTTTAATTSLQLQFPEVLSDTFMEMAVTTDPAVLKPFLQWRTLVRPAGKALIQYQGQKELLPPPDFDAYWSQAKKELAAVPGTPRITRAADKDTSTGLLFRVEIDSVQDTTIVCWYYVPKDAWEGQNPDGKLLKTFPAVLIYPGYGAEEPPIDRTKSGYITCSVNPRNHGPSRSFWKSPVEHLLYNITDHQNYYYKLAFLDCLRAAQFVFSRPEVDARLVGTEGGSQGGLFAIATAALEPRISCVVANIPAFTDFPDGMVLAVKGGHTTMRDLMNGDQTTAALVGRSLSYIDGVNMATRVKCPVMICMGGQDPVCPYLCGVVLHNRIPKGVPRELHVIDNAKHEVPRTMRELNQSWYKRWLGR